MSDRIIIIRLACANSNYKWPKELYTGIMFYMGYKITVEEFNEQVRLFK